MKKITKNIKVLIVEDDKDICEMYAITFMRAGFTVYTAPDGRAALQKFKKKMPDIILLDIMMPHINGYQVLKEIRKNVTKYIPVIMLSNLNASDFAEESELENIDAYLIKSHHGPSAVVDKTIDVLKMNKIVLN